MQQLMVMTFIMPNSYLTSNPTLVKRTSLNSTVFAPTAAAIALNNSADNI